MRCVGGNLRVVTERQSSIGVMHHARLRIAGAHPRFALGLLSLFVLLQLAQLYQGTFQPLLLLAPGAGLGLFCFWIALVVPRIAHLPHALPRSLQMSLDRSF